MVVYHASFMHFLVWLLFCFCLQAEENEAPPPLALANTEGIGSGIVAGKVSAITGCYVEVARDLVVAGAEPLPLERSYLGPPFLITSLQHGWQNNYSSYAMVWKHPTQGWVAHYCEPSCSRTYYEGGSVRTSGIPLSFCYQINKQGLTNCGSYYLSAQTNLKNHKLAYDSHKKEVLVTHGSGCKRIYHRHNPKSVSLVEITQEMRPNGNSVDYDYDPKGNLTRVKTPFNFLKFNNLTKEEFERNPVLEVTASDHRQVRYRFRKIVPTRREKEKLKCYKRYVLTEVQYPGGKENYEYVKTPGGFYDYLSKKICPDHRYLNIEYYFDHPNPSINRRVRQLSAPVGTDREPVVTHRFEYNVHTNNYGLTVAAGSTEVFDAMNNKTRYLFTQEERLSSITKFQGPGESGLVSVESFQWGDENSCECSQLKRHVLQDRNKEVFVIRNYNYDGLGNVWEERLGGNLTGQHHTLLNSNMIEYVSVFYSYSCEGMNLPVSRQDFRKKETYRYKPRTNLRTSAFTEVEGKIVKREFFVYDQNGVITVKIHDDGSQEDIGDLTDATERRMTFITPRREAPIGLPEIEEEMYRDLTTGAKKLLKRTVNTHSPEGWLLKQDIYGSGGEYCYSLHWEYNARGNVVKEVDALGNATFRNYDANGNLTYEQGPRLDMHKEFFWDYSNRLIREEEVYENGLRLTVHHRYNYLGNRIATTDIYGNETRFEYDLEGRLIQTLMPTTYNVAGEPLETRISSKYNALGHLLSQTDANGCKKEALYNVYGKPIFISYPDGSQESFMYELDGALLKAVAKNGSYTLYENDYQGRPIKKSLYSSSGELLNTTSATYSAFHILSETDAAGKVTDYTYDGAGRLVRKKKNDQDSIFVYDTLGREIEKRERFGEGTDDFVIYCKDYDFLNRITSESIKDPLGNVIELKEFGYDVDGNKNKIVTYNQAGTCTQSLLYDAHKYPILVTDALGNVTRTRIDYRWVNAQGQQVRSEETTDPLGNVKVTIYDAKGQVAQELCKNSLGQLTAKREFFYDPVGNRIQRIETVLASCSERVVATEWGYDAARRVTRIQEASGTIDQKVTTLTYTLSGEKEAVVKPDGVILHHVYDALGRLNSFSSTDGTVGYRYTYDTLNNPIRVEDTVVGQETLRVYDENNRLNQERLANGLLLHYSYDSMGRVTKVELPDGSFQESVWESVRLREARRLTSGGELSYRHRYTDYDLSGNLVREELALNQGDLLIDYDLLGRMVQVKGPHWEEALSYDAVGNLSQRISQGVPCDYHFDDLYQLSSETGHTYVHDSLYNRISKDGLAATLNELNQLLSDGKSHFSYDRNGNLIEQEGEKNFRLTYDALDRIIQVETEGQFFTYSYDERNRRLKKSSLHNTEFYLYVDQNEVGSCNQEGQLIEYRLLGNARGAEIGGAVALELEGSFYTPIHDFQGSVALLLQSGKQVAASYSYSAFGEETLSNTLCPWRFSSKRVDEETGFIYFGRRYFDPTTARWITPDPLGFDAGPNLYAYVLNSPLTHFDTYGLHAVSNIPGYFMAESIANGTVGEDLRLLYAVMKNCFTQDPSVRTDFTEKNSFNREPPLCYTIGGETLPNRGFGFTNGINNSLALAHENAAHFSNLAGGIKTDVIYNPTVALGPDMVRHWCSRLNIASHTVSALHKTWDTFFQNVPSDARYLQVGHSDGVANIKNALMTYSETERQRIHVLAIAPSCFIDKHLCGDVLHLRSRDFIPYLDFQGLQRNSDTIRVIPPHKNDPYWVHGFQCKTYETPIRKFVNDFKGVTK